MSSELKLQEKNLQGYLTNAFKKNSNSIAIVNSVGKKITYKKLLQDVSEYYWYILDLYGERKKILLMLSDIEKLIAAMLACIYTNNTFIPISRDCPADLLGHIKKVVTDAVEINDDSEVHKYGEKIIPFDSLTIDEMVPTYIYFTSGTTGTPKAVLGKNESLLHFILWEIDEFGLDSNHCFGQITNPMHDCFMRDVFVPLIAGGKVVLRNNDEIIFFPRRFKAWINENNINCIHCTPTHINMFTSGLKKGDLLDMEYLFIAGEKILNAFIDRWNVLFPEKTSFINLYGPTETTLAKCFYRIDRKDYINHLEIPVGLPIRDEVVHVIDECNKECLDGMVGEIFIGMQYGTWGYLNDSENGKFVYLNNNSKNLFYKTGDIGYKRDGLLYLVGRNDRQVKIRGIRIELDAVENAIMKKFRMNNVMVFEDNNSIIVGIECNEEIVNDEAIIEYLRNTFMINHIRIQVITVKNFYITKNGKKDYIQTKNEILRQINLKKLVDNK